ncbi:uncharacterized protein [Aegilops tauschii subsp. strangulata]|uniref:uncharacterized protein n=1 Tax=Aegilops tauschii subsp. strangulata TaxID=200361 RepID=UPI003CC8ABC4
MVLKADYAAKENNEVDKQMNQVGAQKEIVPNKAKQEQDVHDTEGKGDQKVTKDPKRRTFKRLEGPKVKQQQQKRLTEAKAMKRNVVLMEFEVDAGATKKAGMEVDGEEEKDQTEVDGDFNEIMCGHEKKGGPPRNLKHMESFRIALADCGLRDLGFKGDKFTWRNNNHDAKYYIKERLDRAVASREWCNRFPTYTVLNGDPRHSDHRPVTIQIEAKMKIPRAVNGRNFFRFEARWLDEEECEVIVNNAWNDANLQHGGNVAQGLQRVAANLKNWDENVLGDLQKRIKQLKQQLEETRRGDIDQQRVDTEHFLKYKLDRLEHQIDTKWKQRAHRKRSGRKGYAAIKLDMSKAYDRVEGKFLQEMMLRLGFNRRWIELVMKCVTIVRYQIKVNGDVTETIIPERGLRLGDPLSPYLSLICAEGFSAMLHEAERKGRLKGIKICNNAPSVSHLLFADDSLLLIEAERNSVQEVNRILSNYEACSGQVVNKEKSAILFSKNTKVEDKGDLMKQLNIAREGFSGKYLGMPVYIGKSKVKAFQYLKEKVWKLLQGWKEKLLSKAGKEILIKAVAQAIPVYAMACFDLTKSLCDEISSMIGKYWWSNMDKENKIHRVSWENMTTPKKDGGLGFRDLHSFNLAMLARQAWRILKNPTSLCAEILSAKYFPDRDLLNTEAKSGISYCWRSILKGVQVLKNVSHSWDAQLIEQTFSEEDANTIISIPIQEGAEDIIALHFDKKGNFSVKSAYQVVLDNQGREADEASTSATHTPEGNIKLPWKKLWALPLPEYWEHLKRRKENRQDKIQRQQ